MKQFYIVAFFVVFFVSCTKKSQCNLIINTIDIYKIDNGNYRIPVTLVNKSKDSLRYLSWACSWTEQYHIQSKKFKIKQNVCFTNCPMILIIAPHQSKTVEIELIDNNPKRKSHDKIKIGFNFIETEIKNVNNEQLAEELKKENILWSKLIKL